MRQRSRMTAPGGSVETDGRAGNGCRRSVVVLIGIRSNPHGNAGLAAGLDGGVTQGDGAGDGQRGRDAQDIRDRVDVMDRVAYQPGSVTIGDDRGVGHVSVP